MEKTMPEFYDLEARSNHDFCDTPEAFRFNLNEGVAKKIMVFSALCAEHDLFCVQHFFDDIDPITSDEDYRVDLRMLCVSRGEVWVSANIKNTDIDMFSARIEVAKIAEDFGLPLPEHLKAIGENRVA